MLDIIIIIVGIIIILLDLALILRFLIQYLKLETEINYLILFFFICMGLGVIYDCVRIHGFIFIGSTVEFVDQFFFALKVTLIYLSTYFIFQLGSIFVIKIDQKTKTGAFFRYSNAIVLITFSFINLFTFTKTNINELGFYSYKIHELLYFSTLAYYIPLLIYMIIKSKIFIKEIKNKTLLNKLLLLLIPFTIFLLERFFNIGHFNLIPYSIYIILLDFSIIAVLTIITCILFLKNPAILEALNTYFSVTSIHIMNKDGGQMIYSYDFTKKNSADTFSPSKLLLGGFISAISSGLRESLKLNGKIETIKVGNSTLIFQHGKYVFGLLFVKEDTPMLHLKLLTLMQKFEITFEKYLKNWTGVLSKFKPEIIDEWVLEYFS